MKNIFEDANRATGRTIRLMLKELLSMSEQPNEWIELVDHWDSRGARLHHKQWIREVASDLGMRLEIKEHGERIFMRFVL